MERELDEPDFNPLPEIGFPAWLVYGEDGTYEWLPPVHAGQVVLWLCRMRDLDMPTLRVDAPPVDLAAPGTLFLVTVEGAWTALDATLRQGVEVAAYPMGKLPHKTVVKRGAQWAPYARELGVDKAPPPPGYSHWLETMGLAVKREEEIVV